MTKKNALFKLSGEYLAGQDGKGYEGEGIKKAVQMIQQTQEAGWNVAIVIGGGNIWRGRNAEEIELSSIETDQIGMGASSLNALMLSLALRSTGISAQSYAPDAYATADTEPYRAESAKQDLKNGVVVVMGGGIGTPGFTTDTTVVIRALELEVEKVIKFSTIDGVYSEDPKKNPKALRYESLSYDEALKKELGIMDMSAFLIARDHGLSIIITQYESPQKLLADLGENPEGTLLQ